MSGPPSCVAYQQGRCHKGRYCKWSHGEGGAAPSNRPRLASPAAPADGSAATASEAAAAAEGQEQDGASRRRRVASKKSRSLEEAVASMKRRRLAPPAAPADGGAATGEVGVAASIAVDATGRCALLLCAKSQPTVSKRTAKRMIAEDTAQRAATAAATALAAAAAIGASAAWTDGAEPPPMTLPEARNVAHLEGLRLIASTTECATGFKGVSSYGRAKDLFQATVKSPGTDPVKLGGFDSVAEAALAYSRHLGPEFFAASATPTMTLAEARRLAAAEGLDLVFTMGPMQKKPTENFKGVRAVECGEKGEVCFEAYETGATAKHLERFLGRFSSAPRAALEYARHLGPEFFTATATAATTVITTTKAAAAKITPLKTYDEIRTAAEAEGLHLVPSCTNVTGYKSVNAKAGYGPTTTSGQAPALIIYRVSELPAIVFSSAPEAALAYARHIGQAAAAAAASAVAASAPWFMSEATAQQLAKEEGLELVRSCLSIYGFANVRCAERGPGKTTSHATFWWAESTMKSQRYHSAAEAALAYARHLGPVKSTAAAVAESVLPMSPLEAHRLAQTEGLKLLRCVCTSGFTNVAWLADRRLFAATALGDSRGQAIGYFRSPAEAALAVARSGRPEVDASLHDAKSNAPDPCGAAAACGAAKSSVESVQGASASCDAGQQEATEPVAEASVNADGVGERELAVPPASHVAPGTSAALSSALRAKPLTEKQCLELAVAEDLVLITSDRAVSGFRGVFDRGVRRYDGCLQVQPSVHSLFDAQGTYLDSFIGVYDAALAYARRLGPAGSRNHAHAAKTADIAASAAAALTKAEAERMASCVCTAAARSGLHRNIGELHATSASMPSRPEAEEAEEGRARQGKRKASQVPLEPLYQVEELLEARWTLSGKRQFRVRWLGYGARSDSWEPEANIIDPELIRELDRGQSAASRGAQKRSRDSAGGSSSSAGGRAIAGKARSARTPADAAIVAQLAAMGFPERLCHRAALATKNGGAAPAIEWLLSQDHHHVDEAVGRNERVAGAPAAGDACARDGDGAVSNSSGVASHGLWKSPPVPVPAPLAAGLPRPRLGHDHQAVLPECRPDLLLNPVPDGAVSAPQFHSSADVAAAAARDTAATLTAAAYGPLDSLCFVSPCDCGLGLFVRGHVGPGQLICEYDGPRLPGRLQVRGQYVLEVPGTSFVIDGASENSPFECERSPAVYANHSAAPNARLEKWAVPRAGPLEVRERMVLVASEHIEPGQEVRINYEGGSVGTYWHVLGEVPAEGAWREARIRPPPAAGGGTARVAAWSDEPVCSALWQCRSPIPWEGRSGGDTRLHAIVPLLSTNGRQANASAWPLVSTHVPGRSGRECRDRWQIIQDLGEHSEWLQPASRAVSHAEAAASLARANREAALAALAAVASDDSGDDCDERVRCCISGCRRQLLSCSGRKHAGSAVGCAKESHYLCAPCLYRWLASETSLRAERGLNALNRRTCPVCKSELRAAASAVRVGADCYVMGLLKVADTW